MDATQPIGTRFVTWVRPSLPVIDSIASSESRSTLPTHAKRCVWEVISKDHMELVESVAYYARWVVNTTKDTYEWELIPQSEVDSGWIEPMRIVESEIDHSAAAILEVRVK